MGHPAVDISAMTPAERLDLIGQLWDSLQDQDVPVDAEHRAVLDARLTKLEEVGADNVAWGDVHERWKRERGER